MKKRIFAIAVVVLCLSVLASTTIAYFTDIATARNIITSGGVTVELLEQQLVDGKLLPYPRKEPIPVMPTSQVSKIVSVKGIENDAWVRMCYSITAFDADGEKIKVSSKELSQVVIIEPDRENWTEDGGWWYYNKALTNGLTTQPLFETVTFSGPNMGNKYQGSTVVIDVTVQAVQKAHNGTSALDAAGWPED